MEQRAPTRPPLPTVADYFAAERASPVRHEFRRGQIIAMTGGTDDHSLIGTNTAGELRARLKPSPCRAYNSDLRVLSRPGAASKTQNAPRRQPSRGVVNRIGIGRDQR